MLIQMALGSVMIVISIIVQAIFIEVISKINWSKGSVTAPRAIHLLIFVSRLSAVALWLLTSLSIIVWMWAFLLLHIGEFHDLETSLYFSATAFTTLGLGDVTLSQDWRLLSGFIAADGFIIFGLMTACFFEVLSELRQFR